MRYIKSITQQKLSFLLAIYIGLFMNGAVFYRRFGSYAHDFTVWKGISAVVELAATVLVTFFFTTSSFAVWPPQLAYSGIAGGALFRRCQLLHDLP